MKSKVVTEIIALVKNGKIQPLYDESERLIGLNYLSGSTGMKYSKMIQGHMCVGATEAELEADIAAYKNFAEKVQGLNVQEMLEIAMILNKPEMTDEDQERVANYFDKNARVETREVVRTVEKTGNGQYPNLAQDLTSLDDETLKDLMNKARRENARDLFNAVRRERRHRGVSC